MSRIYLSWGMGVESTAILLRWLIDPTSRNFPLSQLSVITAQTGDEHRDTKALCERYILPLLRANNIRLVQVARAGRLEQDGIEVLDDSPQPHKIHIEGSYKLSDELLFAGTVPQFAGVHKCALKFKAFVLDEWLVQEQPGTYRHAFGYNAEETSRISKSEYATTQRIAFGFNSDEQNRVSRANEYSTIQRSTFYPLVDWHWNREACNNFLYSILNIRWPRSFCTFCPFASLKGTAIERLTDEPQQLAHALMVEYTSLCFNHRSTLYKTRSLISLIRDQNPQAIDAFHQLRQRTPMATYRVRRIMTSKGHGHRCTEQLTDTDLNQLITQYRLNPVMQHPGDYDIETAFAIEREFDHFPTREEFYVRAPDTVASRARHGIPWFEAKWREAAQAGLF